MVKPASPKRAARLALMGAGLAGSYQLRRPFASTGEAEGNKQAFQRQAARNVREELQTLRGPVMKLGQFFSLQTQALGPEWIEELANLQREAPPMHASLMRAQFKSAFGKHPEEVFRSFEPEPFAAASLGQVHWAVAKDGEPLAVKIQYPAIREAIESDFKMLRTAGFAARLTGYLKDSVISEAERGILAETDYEQEAKNIEFFARALEPLKFIRLPSVRRDLSCGQVLSMSRVSGMRLQDFLKTRPSQEQRDALGAKIAHLFFFQLTRARAMHADPHPGNFLFGEDGTLGLVDFGCVKYLKPEVIECYGQFWSREWLKDDAAYARMVRALFGHDRMRKKASVRQCLEELAKFYDEFHPLTKPAALVDLGDPKFMGALWRLAKALIQYKFLTPEFVFLSRADLGICNLLHILKARVKTTEIAREYILTKPRAGR